MIFTSTLQLRKENDEAYIAYIYISMNSKIIILTANISFNATLIELGLTFLVYFNSLRLVFNYTESIKLRDTLIKRLKVPDSIYALK